VSNPPEIRELHDIPICVRQASKLRVVVGRIRDRERPRNAHPVRKRPPTEATLLAHLSADEVAVLDMLSLGLAESSEKLLGPCGVTTIAS